MGHPEMPWCLPEVRGLSRDDGIALLDGAAEVGLLTRHGGGYYGIHPALPWFFRGLFERHYGASKEAATRAFVEAVGELGNYYYNQYSAGDSGVIAALRADETNLLQARRLARVHRWWVSVIKTMQALYRLYEHTGRRVEWKRLVEEIVPDFIDPVTEGPLAGREEHWGVVNLYLVGLAREERNWAKAERLQRAHLKQTRQRAAPILDRARDSLNEDQRLAVRGLAVSLEHLGHIQSDQGRDTCVTTYQEALELFESIGERAAAANCAFSIGHAHKNITDLHDLDQADYWYRRSLELRDDRDRLGRSHSLGAMGHVAWERFKAARDRNAGKDELMRHLNDAAEFYHEKLDLTPADAVNSLAVGHHQLGVIYGDAGDIDRALVYLREAIRYYEQQGDVYHASKARRNLARTLTRSDRHQDALTYAEAALRGFESYGESAAEDVEVTRELIEDILQQP